MRRAVLVLVLLFLQTATDQPWPWEEPYYERAQWNAQTKTWTPLSPLTEWDMIWRWAGGMVRG